MWWEAEAAKMKGEGTKSDLLLLFPTGVEHLKGCRGKHGKGVFLLENQLLSKCNTREAPALSQASDEPSFLLSLLL